MRDFRTVIQGRVGWGGRLYSHAALARFEGQEVAVIGSQYINNCGRVVADQVNIRAHDADGKKVFLVLEVQP